MRSIRHQGGIVAFVLLVFFHGAWGVAESGLMIPDERLGANFASDIFAETPLVPHIWIPQATWSGSFHWLEPLQNRRLGERVDADTRYLRYHLTARVSPWYGSAEALMGVRVIPRFEFSMAYQLVGYWASNVEISMAGLDTDRTLRDTWRADYFWEQYASIRQLDRAQWFSMGVDLDFSGKYQASGVEWFYHLVDVGTDNDGKNQDFARNLPVHKKDFLMQARLWFALPVGACWWWRSSAEYQQTGLISKIWGVYNKEAIRQGLIFSGLEWRFGRDRISGECGFFVRSSAQMSAELWEQLMIRLRWQKHWFWPNPDSGTR